jgi:ComF family protein
MGRRLADGVGRLGTLLLDQLYPPACLCCEAPLAQPHALCGACFRQLRPITPPLCPVLGLPFEVPLGPEARSAQAIAAPPPFARARAAVVYTAVARTLVSRLKYGDRPELARFCGRLMAAAGHEFWAAGPVLVPVPLHLSRQFERRYNQSAGLCREIARLTGLAVDAGLIRRRRRTRQQVGLSAGQRERNVEGAFAVHPEALARLRGRGAVIVDDVVTTGSTVNAVARALRRAGVERIEVLSFARVVAGLDAA